MLKVSFKKRLKTILVKNGWDVDFDFTNVVNVFTWNMNMQSASVESEFDNLDSVFTDIYIMVRRR